LQYNRYLIISCSRENSPLPANLQGLWNDNLAANMPWTCDYHLDINTQQNYWATNVTNLAECNAPLFNYIEYLSKAGEKTAAKVYGSPGWVAHTVTNVWGYTAPGEWPGWGLFPAAGTWIALHLREHYNYTLDKGFLVNKAYPLLRKNAEFFLDYMVTDPVSGYLMTGPCTSPENSFRYKGDVLSLSMMPTCDRVFVYELFNACISASEILNIDEAFRSSLKEAVSKLPPLKIGKTGELQEWFYDYEKAIPNHRHTTHLTSLYPYSQISPERTPELAIAAAKTIQYRLDAPGWEDVEWSRANMINFFARLKEPEKALNSINILLKDLTRENLLTISVAGIAGANYDIFVLDGNEAAASGIAEMLIQSHEDYIEFLPALPVEWKTGYYKGLCVRGGATVSVDWVDMKIRKASLHASVNNSYSIKIPDASDAKFLKNGKDYKPESISGSIARVDLRKDDILDILY
jgi:alpha-L-fucosidase 2